MSSLPIVLDYVAALGHAVFTRGEFNLNIIGIRTTDSQANTFDDRLCAVYRDELGWVTRTWSITTDPGVYFREHPMNVSGTAIMVPGQYRGAYKLGRHRGKYLALVQTGARVAVYRDANKDEVLDMGNPTDGYFGINIHRASTRDGGSQLVDRWSAGCQVFGDPKDFDDFIKLCQRSAQTYGERFTYTLIDAPV